MPDTEALTELLCNARLDAAERDERLLPLIYEELRRIAQRRLASERSDHTLQATALVHETYLRVVANRQVPWQNRSHFFSAAAEAMRRILIDHAKARGRAKRGGKMRRISLRSAEQGLATDPAELLSLDEAFCRLTNEDPDIADVVRLRFFGGLSIDETAEVLSISPATVKRRWEFARSWLFRAMSSADEDEGKK